MKPPTSRSIVRPGAGAIVAVARAKRTSPPTPTFFAKAQVTSTPALKPVAFSLAR
jgi:hypothetical protein